MNALTQELLKKIEEASTARELDGWIWKVGDLIAKSSHKEYHSGFLEIDSIEVSPEESEILKLALLEALKRSSDPSFVSQILNSLIMTLDPNLKTLYLSYLERYSRQLKDCNHVVYSVLDGLNRLGEDVYEPNERGGSSQSVIDINKNVRQAHRYLAGMGIEFTW